MSSRSSRRRPACRRRQLSVARPPPTLLSRLQTTSSKYSDAQAGARSLKFMIGLSAAMALGAMCVISALAAAPKPDAVIKTRSIEARIFLDDKIRADAALADDCLAE